MIRIIAKLAKVTMNRETRKLMERLITEAYEAGQVDRARDIRDELRSDRQHVAANFIEANWAV